MTIGSSIINAHVRKNTWIERYMVGTCCESGLNGFPLGRYSPFYCSRNRSDRRLYRYNYIVISVNGLLTTPRTIMPAEMILCDSVYDMFIGRYTSFGAFTVHSIGHTVGFRDTSDHQWHGSLDCWWSDDGAGSWAALSYGEVFYQTHGKLVIKRR